MSEIDDLEDTMRDKGGCVKRTLQAVKSAANGRKGVDAIRKNLVKGPVQMKRSIRQSNARRKGLPVSLAPIGGGSK
jgi:hypothetical protein